MAYFECTIGGASGDGVALIVQCDANFAGSTITADNGEDVFTETCPSVSPYTVRFEGIPTGTYTISGVAQGQTYTTQFTVLDYETTLRSIPEGATVLPINDIQIWLHCANIWDKNYTTITQVLADASTLQNLIASNNAADYMARSTSWASSVCANANAMSYIGANAYCATKLLSNSTWLNAICNSTYFENVLNVKVPTMTSNTTPSGEVIYSSYYADANPPFAAFDNNTNSNYFPSGSDTQSSFYLGYDFGANKKVRVNKIRISYRDSGDAGAYTNHYVKFQGSNSKTSGYVDITSPIQLTPYIDDKYLVSTNANGYRYYRMVITAGGAPHVVGQHALFISTMQFWGGNV